MNVDMIQIISKAIQEQEIGLEVALSELSRITENRNNLNQLLVLSLAKKHGWTVSQLKLHHVIQIPLTVLVEHFTEEQLEKQLEVTTDSELWEWLNVKLPEIRKSRHALN